MGIDGLPVVLLVVYKWVLHLTWHVVQSPSCLSVRTSPHHPHWLRGSGVAKAHKGIVLGGPVMGPRSRLHLQLYPMAVKEAA